ncbi:class I SAM-dependent methyltransferase [Candidatus Woesearchaeota archaeon]|nr:class I SAM-dependent methyltransferase [Candidatus Woesearchaeota archaeon]
MECRICRNNDLKEFLSLGKTPLANSFLPKESLSLKEESFPLAVCFCQDCKLVQLTYVVPAEAMFKNYVYVSSTSGTFRAHFARMAEDISKDFNLDEKSLAVDVGSNDGILLKGFKRFNVRTIGVEPAANVAKIAEENGVETINGFFGKDAAKEIVARKGHADVVTAANVFAHVNDIDDFAENVKFLLKKDGILVIEVQYLVDTIEKMTFDNIYHEHLSYFTLTSLANFFKRHEMEIFDAQRVDSHGGSLRVFAKKNNGSHKAGKNVGMILKHEQEIGVEDLKLYREFAGNVYSVRENLKSCLEGIKNKGMSIAGYGAPAKSTTLLNFCGIGRNFLDYIVDENPLKIGLYTPGTRIPVVGPDALDKKKPDYVLILAWNFAEEILAKTKKYSGKGVKFIIPLPELRTI